MASEAGAQAAAPAPPAAPIARSMPEPWAKRELLAVREIAKLVGKSFEPGVTIRSMLHLLSELLGLNRGRVLLRNGVSNEIAIAHAYGLRPDEIRRGVFKVGEGITGRTFKTGGILIVQDIDDEPLYLARTVDRADLPQETVSYIALPILIDGAVDGVLAVHRLRRRDRALADDLHVLQIVASLIGQIVNINRLASEKTARLESENFELKSALSRSARSVSSYGIVGESAVLHAALRQIEQVSQTDATILLLGESGTGKELFARALHLSSPRRDAPFIRVNCGAIPESLFESELFGHEKGAFTGATGMRRGRFEQAEGGTLLLDEISDLPLAMQVKMLRVLQEQTVERVGGQREIPIDVRIVAATNQDLQRLVAQGKFRLDLFYRLNVIPITLPSLRERRDDIRQLVRFYLNQVNQSYQRNVGITAEALDELTGYDWPGNVRQLRNIIERLSLLANGPLIHAGDVTAVLAAETGSAVAHGDDAAPTMATGKPAGSRPALVAGPADATPAVRVRDYQQVDVDERAPIEDALRAARNNKSRAAQRLGMTLRQLNYRMKVLAIALPAKD
ncbi:MAG: sigma 54-interacting transcriptional regulator [Herminiimonas sp.]|nr:sigma 54-interacting transcriptional regulator [Herminiimonas sp.]